MITTYHLANADGAHFSPHAWRTTMALAHKGLEHESRGVAFTEIGTICDGERKIVPTIEDGEQVLSDSWAIALHLEDSVTSGRSLFGGEKGKAHALFINNWASFGLQPLLLQIMILELFERLQDRDKAYFRESREKRFGRSLEDHAALADEAKQRLPAMLAPLSMTLNSQAWLGGDVPSYADYIALGAFQWVRTSSSFDLPGFAGEKVADWHAAMLDLHDGLARTNT
ncbi:MAG: glutathione binding-like protein [Pseudomonadota bacterium]|nr:glutathione binding-like protein [Pseudomonadota bacterium]